jgi:hypothetical protein
MENADLKYIEEYIRDSRDEGFQVQIINIIAVVT